MPKLILRVFVGALAAAALYIWPSLAAKAAEWTIIGTVLGNDGIISDGAVSVSGHTITAVGPRASIPASTTAIKVPGIILPGFIDLHNHLTWNVLPRWQPERKFNNRYEWQDTTEFYRKLVAPYNAVLRGAPCESQIYAEIKAMAGGAPSVLGSLLPKDYPDAAACVGGLARNLDIASGLPFNPPDENDPCEKASGSHEPLLDVVGNEVFPMELPHARMDFLLCELATGRLRSLVIHLAEGAASDASAHR